MSQIAGEITLDGSDRTFLQLLHRVGRQTIKALCEEIGVTANAVRVRLQRLEEMSLIAREAIREGRGRPQHVFFVTELGRKQLGDNYEDLALVLWSKLREITDPDLRQALLDKVRDTFVAKYGGHLASAAVADLFARFEQLRENLAAHGLDVEVDKSGELPILRENHCPYLELAHHDTSICDLEQQVFSEILGQDVHLSQCCLDGHNCCEFAVSNN